MKHKSRFRGDASPTNTSGAISRTGTIGCLCARRNRGLLSIAAPLLFDGAAYRQTPLKA